MSETATELIDFFTQEIPDKDLANSIITKFINEFAGGTLYIPVSLKRTIKAMAIYRELKEGKKPKYLARKYNVSLTHVYDILKKRVNLTLDERTKNQTQEKLFI